jgi:hypothetical protein
MPLHASNLLEPKGELEAPVLWPGVELTVVVSGLDEYLAEGYIKAAAIDDADNKDEAARQWAYHRAYRQKWKALLGLPSSVTSSDEGSSSYTQAQIDEWSRLASESLAHFNALISASAGASAVPRVQSASVNMVTTW